MLDCCGQLLRTLFDSLFLSSVGRRRRRRDLHHLIIFVFSWHLFLSTSQVHHFSVLSSFQLKRSSLSFFTLLLPLAALTFTVDGWRWLPLPLLLLLLLLLFLPLFFSATDYRLPFLLDLAVQFSVCATLSVAAAAANHSVVLGICQQQQLRRSHRHQHQHQHLK